MLIRVQFTARKQLNFKYETQINTDVCTSPSRYIQFSLRNMKVCLVYFLLLLLSLFLSYGAVIFEFLHATLFLLIITDIRST